MANTNDSIKSRATGKTFIIITVNPLNATDFF